MLSPASLSQLGDRHLPPTENDLKHQRVVRGENLAQGVSLAACKLRKAIYGLSGQTGKNVAVFPEQNKCCALVANQSAPVADRNHEYFFLAGRT